MATTEKIAKLEKGCHSLLQAHQDFLFRKYGYSPELEVRIKQLEHNLKQEFQKFI
ncbi:hypothetical protein ACVRXQ_06080 [Streptococcus panodentis]|uniref:hypothetical protein n=1 Tax=Streptococcus panodentis TaxID=1581472 RepID=UPI001AE6ACF9|nr:hypothetical protein [Streptococcus panodentis]